MKCELESYMICSEPFGEAKTQTMCRTHNWPLDSLPVSTNTLCPIGRIEQATEEAIEKIRAAR